MKSLNNKQIAQVSGACNNGEAIITGISGAVIGYTLANAFLPTSFWVPVAASVVGFDLGLGIGNWAQSGNTPNIIVIEAA